MICIPYGFLLFLLWKDWRSQPSNSRTHHDTRGNNAPRERWMYRVRCLVKRYKGRIAKLPGLLCWLWWFHKESQQKRVVGFSFSFSFFTFLFYAVIALDIKFSSVFLLDPAIVRLFHCSSLSFNSRHQVLTSYSFLFLPTPISVYGDWWDAHGELELPRIGK